MDVPHLWEGPTIGELCDLINGRAFKPTDWTASGLPIVRIQNLKDAEAPLNHFDGEVREQFLIDTGQLLFAWSGTPGTSFGAHIWERGPAVLNQHIFRVQFNERLIDKTFFRYAINEKVGELIRRAHGGVGLAHVTKGVFESTRVGLPPLAEQRRIVAKLDALTARTARARADLDRIPGLAARYKQAVLAKAFSGELTAEWRKGAVGGALWQDVSVGEVAEITSGFGFPKDRQGLTEGDFPFAKVSDISKAVANDSGMLSRAANYVRKADLVTLRAKPVPAGSVVFAKIGEALRLNRRALATTGVILDNNCMALSPDVSRVAPRFLYQFMRTIDLSPFAVATAVPSVRRGDVASLRMPLPPIAEQEEIDRRINYAFAEIDRLTAEAAAARRLLDRLDQSVLAKAFRGELVPQDPADEPASVLLDRIRVERAAAPKAKRGRKRAVA